MKKTIAVFLSLVLIIGTFSGCGLIEFGKDSSNAATSNQSQLSSVQSSSSSQSSSSKTQTSSKKPTSSVKSSTSEDTETETPMTEKEKILAGLDSTMFKTALLNEGNMSRIANAMKKAQKGGTITVGVLGGSITAGAGASSDDSTYANLVKLWWENNFPKATIKLVNAGFGSSNAEMACYRMDNDLLKYNPDFVIVDFAVNIYLNESHLMETYEALLYRIMKSKNSPGVISVVFTSTDPNQYQQGRFIQNVAKIDEANNLTVAQSFGVPVISYNKAVWQKIKAKKIVWDDIGYDYIHPNDAGHLIASSLINSYLDKVKGKLSSISASAPAIKVPKNNAFLDVRALNQTNASSVSLGSFYKDLARDPNSMGWTYTSGDGTSPLKMNISNAKQVRLFITMSSDAVGSLQTSFSGTNSTITLNNENLTPSIARTYVYDSVAATGSLSIVPSVTKGSVTIYGIFIK